MGISVFSFFLISVLVLCGTSCSLPGIPIVPIPAAAMSHAQSSQSHSPVSSSSSDYANERRDWVNHDVSPSVPNAVQARKPRIRDAAVEKPPMPIASNRVLSVNAVNMQLASLLYALASDSLLQLELHEPLQQPVTLKAANVTLDQVLGRISMQTPLYWQVTDEILHVWGSESYTETYPINYLNLQRTLTSRVGLATQVGTINSTNDGASGVANSSETRVENIAEHRYWQSVQLDVEALLEAVGAPHSVTVNADAGFLTLHGSGQAHAALAHYLERLAVHSDRQVLIQASVIEVVLDDAYSAGVDWQVIGKGLSSVSALQALTPSSTVTAESVDRIPAPAGLLSWVFQDSDVQLSATLSLLEQFGEVRIVSRPQLLALNNQSAVLKVVDNRVYFAVNVERRSGENRDEIITQTDIRTVPVGLVMNVTPFLGEDDLVMLNVRPTLSRILGFVNDPNPELVAANISNGVPEIQIREMESLLRIRSGETAVIGGLMQETADTVVTGIPFLSGLPAVGSLFRSTKQVLRKTELIILLHPTVSI